MIKRLFETWKAKSLEQVAGDVNKEFKNVADNALDGRKGATGTFTTADGKTVTVVEGQIVKIEP